MRVLIVGCGYVGLPLGVELQRAGHDVAGLRRSRSAEATLQAAGILPLVADITDPASLDELPNTFDWVVLCTAAGGGGLGSPPASKPAALPGSSSNRVDSTLAMPNPVNAMMTANAKYLSPSVISTSKKRGPA